MIKLLLTFTVFLLGFTSIVFSQAPPDSTSPANLENSQTTPVEQLQTDYLFQLEKYRQVNQQFTFDQTQFQQLGTLASEEKFVASSKLILNARTKVLQTYLYVLKAKLNSIQGVDINDRQKAINQIDQSLQLINSHQQSIIGLADRLQTSQESARFESETIPLFFEAAYRSLALLTIGPVQTVTDQVLVSARDFKQESLDYQTDPNLQATIKRGLTRATLEQTQAQDAIDQARASFTAFNETDPRNRRKINPQSIYQSVIDQLNPAFASLLQAVELLSELDRIVNQ